MDYDPAGVRLTSRLAFSFAALLALLGGCRRATETRGAPSSAEPLEAGGSAQRDGGTGGTGIEPLDIPFAGCASLSLAREPLHEEPRPTCELGSDRTLRFALAHGASPPKITVDGNALLPLPRASDDAWFGVAVPENAERLQLDTDIDGRHLRSVLHIAKTRSPAWLEEAKTRRAAGDSASARQIAETHLDDRDERAAMLARGLLARLALEGGRVDDAVPLFRASIGGHHRAGRISDAADDAFALAFALHQRSHRYADARATLTDADSDIARYPEGRARAPYYRGLLASETGDHRTALQLLREAESRAHALGMQRLERNSKSAIAIEMQIMGRPLASLEILRGLEQTSTAACERLELAIDQGWGAILANDAAEKPVADARAPLERAVHIEGCSDAYLRSTALGNLARVSLDEGDVASASRHLTKARAAVDAPRGSEQVEWLDLEARILLARHDHTRALARFDEALELARGLLLHERERSALTGRAEVLERLGRKREAVDALLAAEAILDRTSLFVPLGEGRESFMRDRSRSARAAVDLLVGLGRLGEATHVARRSRARLLTSMDPMWRVERLSGVERERWNRAVETYRIERDALDAEASNDWRLASDALAKVQARRGERTRALREAFDRALAVVATQAPGAPGAPDAVDSPPAGTLDLVVHPGRSGWFVIVADETGKVTATPLPPPDGPPEILAQALFGPIRSRLRTASRVRVMPYGSWRRVDIHALPFDGLPLVAHAAVEYPLGLPTRASNATPNAHALIVGDPSSNLPGAFDEAEDVARVLAATRGMRVERLLRHEATSRAVLAALGEANVFHYAGHGIFAGNEGWESALPLADGGNLSASDILALPHAPRSVVLSGCETARNDGDVEGLGLAQAFVTAGSEEVVAPVRAVSDALAQRLATKLHRAPSTSLRDALRNAQVQLHTETPNEDWSAFRVLSR